MLDLPQDIVEEILSKLNYDDILNIYNVNIHFRRICELRMSQILHKHLKFYINYDATPLAIPQRSCVSRLHNIINRADLIFILSLKEINYNDRIVLAYIVGYKIYANEDLVLFDISGEQICNINAPIRYRRKNLNNLWNMNYDLECSLGYDINTEMRQQMTMDINKFTKEDLSLWSNKRIVFYYVLLTSNYHKLREIFRAELHKYGLILTDKKIRMLRPYLEDFYG